MKDAFFLCYFESTRNCNLACPYCMTRRDGKARSDELSTDEVKSLVIDEMACFSSRSAIAFSGGEFLLRRDALQLLGHTAARGLWSLINTNGTLLDRQRMESVKDVTKGRVMLVLSLNSLHDGEQKWSRSDGLDTIRGAMNLSRETGVTFFFLMTVSRANVGSARETLHYLKMKQIPVIRSPFVPRGLGGEFPELGFSREEMEGVLHPALRADYLSYVSFTPFFASPEVIKEALAEAGVSISQLGCQAGRGFVGISAEGDVAPCVQLLDSGVRCGNVREQPLSEILTKNEVLVALRAREGLGGKCGRCRYRVSCGGCRALAYYRNGSVFAEDPTCFFEPVDETTRSEFEELQNRNVLRFLDYLKYNEPWNSLF